MISCGAQAGRRSRSPDTGAGTGTRPGHRSPSPEPVAGAGAVRYAAFSFALNRHAS